MSTTIDPDRSRAARGPAPATSATVTGEGARIPAGLVLGAVFALVPFLWMISTSFKTPGQLFKSSLRSSFPTRSHRSNYRGRVERPPIRGDGPQLACSSRRSQWSASCWQRGPRGLRLRPLPVPVPERAVRADAEHDDAALGGDPHPELPDLEAGGTDQHVRSADRPGSLFAWGPFYIFLLRQFFLGVSRETSKRRPSSTAPTPVQVLWHVMLPLVKPVLLAVGLSVSFAGQLEQFQRLPLIYLSRNRSSGSRCHSGSSSSRRRISATEAPRWHYMMAMSTVDGHPDPHPVLPRPAPVHRRHPARRASRAEETVQPAESPSDDSSPLRRLLGSPWPRCRSWSSAA